MTAEQATRLRQAVVSRAVEDRYATAEREISQIVEAAYQMIARTGSLNPTVRDILSEAGLSTQAFYRYFPSKTDLLLVLLDEGQAKLASYLEYQMDKTDDPVEKICAWVKGIFFQAREPTATRTRPFITNTPLLAEHYPKEQMASISAICQPLARAIEQAIALGISSSDDAEGDALLTYHVAISEMQRHILARSEPSDQEIANTQKFVRRALGINTVSTACD